MASPGPAHLSSRQREDGRRTEDKDNFSQEQFFLVLWLFFCCCWFVLVLMLSSCHLHCRSRVPGAILRVGVVLFLWHPVWYTQPLYLADCSPGRLHVSHQGQTLSLCCILTYGHTLLHMCTYLTFPPSSLLPPSPLLPPSSIPHTPTFMALEWQMYHKTFTLLILEGNYMYLFTMSACLPHSHETCPPHSHETCLPHSHETCLPHS